MRAVFLDIEATGLNPIVHEPIEIAFKVVELDSGKICASYHTLIFHPPVVLEKGDPESTRIHQISWDEIKTGKPISQIKEEILEIFAKWKIRRGSAVYICQNPAFDRSFFSKIVDIAAQELYQFPYHWLDFASMYWALKVNQCRKGGQSLPEDISLSKNKIAEEYHISPEELPHRAFNGVNHLLLCYKTVIGFLTPSSESKERKDFVCDSSIGDGNSSMHKMGD